MGTRRQEGDPHVIDLAVDYSRGHLSPGEEEEVRLHLMHCRDCSEHFTFVGRIHEDILQSNALHIPPERLVFMAENPAEAMEQREAAHLEACLSCRAELAWARSVPGLEQAESTLSHSKATPEAGSAWEQAASPETPRRSVLPARTWRPAWRRPGWFPRLPAWGWGSMAVGLAGLLLILVIHRPSPSDRYSDLIRIEALPPAQVVRGTEANEDFRRLWNAAMQAYTRADYVQAESSFDRATRVKSASTEEQLYADALLYLGSSRMMQRKFRAAIEPLKRAAELARSPRVKEESLWHLANAYLAAGNKASAEASLRQVIAIGSDREGDAQSLLGQLGAPR